MAFFLAALVWIVAVNEDNPVEQRTIGQVPIELLGKADDMLIMGNVLTRTQVELRGPRQTLATITARQITVTADLSDLPPGTHTIPLQYGLAVEGARIENIDPSTLTLMLERSAVRELPVEVTLVGQPAAGYEAEPPELSAETVTLSGPSSAVDRVAGISVRVSIEGLRSEYRAPITFSAVDADGSPVSGVALSPESGQITVPITQREGFRDVAVKLVITGQVASGYQVTNISVSPNFITVASANPRLVEQMPGFVNTVPLDLTDADDDVVRRLLLELPPGVTVQGEQSVLAQVSIAAIEYSLRVERTLELRGLPLDHSATVSPDTVDVLLLGPLAVLDELSLEDVRIVVDLEGLEPGTYQLAPQVEVLPNGLRADLLLDQVEVVIVEGTPTPTPTVSATATATATVTVTPRPTLPAWTATPSPTPAATDTPEP
jgi:YbbR domain-containing protein